MCARESVCMGQRKILCVMCERNGCVAVHEYYYTHTQTGKEGGREREGEGGCVYVCARESVHAYM